MLLRTLASPGLPAAPGMCLCCSKPHLCSKNIFQHRALGELAWWPALPDHLILPFLPFMCSVVSWSQCRLLEPPALYLASACFLALLYQLMLFPSSPEDRCSRCLYSQFSTGLILLLGLEHQALQLMLNSCLGWSSAGEKTQALIAGAALTSCRQGLEHSRPLGFCFLS